MVKKYNQKRIESQTGELVGIVMDYFVDNKLDPVEGITLAMNVLTYVVANADLEPKDVIDFLSEEMPDQVRLIREDWERE